MNRILKRTAAGIIPAFMVFAMAGCGKSASQTAEEVSKPAEETVAEPAAAEPAAEAESSNEAGEKIARYYYAYAVESGDMCILLSEEDRSGFAFTINADGTGKVHVEDESEDTTWKLDGDVLSFYEMSGEPATAGYDITWNDGIITIVVPPEEEGGDPIYEYLVREGADTLKIDMRAVDPSKLEGGDAAQ